MGESKQEEIIAALWAICAVCSFGYGFTVWGWVFAVNAAIDVVASAYFAVRELRK